MKPSQQAIEAYKRSYLQAAVHRAHRQIYKHKFKCRACKYALPCEKLDQLTKVLKEIK